MTTPEVSTDPWPTIDLSHPVDYTDCDCTSLEKHIPIMQAVSAKKTALFLQNRAALLKRRVWQAYKTPNSPAVDIRRGLVSALAIIEDLSYEEADAAVSSTLKGEDCPGCGGQLTHAGIEIACMSCGSTPYGDS